MQPRFHAAINGMRLLFRQPFRCGITHLENLYSRGIVEDVDFEIRCPVAILQVMTGVLLWSVGIPSAWTQSSPPDNHSPQ